jgi:hypothetical protein
MSAYVRCAGPTCIAVLTSKLCPKHVEATIYAILAGFQNFGQQVARTGGVFLMETLEVVPERRLDDGGPGGGGGCKFDGLPMLLLLSHTLLPMLAVPMTFVLIPDSTMREDLPPPEGEGQGVAKGGESGGGALADRAASGRGIEPPALADDAGDAPGEKQRLLASDGEGGTA